MKLARAKRSKGRKISPAGPEGHQVRSCAVCRGRAPKSELIRFVERGGQLVWDQEQRAQGRGAYLHRSEACWLKASKGGLWQRALRTGGRAIECTASLEAVKKELF